MCSVSMIMDHQYDWWKDQYPLPLPPRDGTINPAPYMPTRDEIEEFRLLLERARQYDIDHNQPDCEMVAKRQKLLDLAEELGIEIDFL